MAYIFDNLLYLFFLFFLLLQLKQQFFVALFHAATVCPRENRASCCSISRRNSVSKRE